MTQQRTTEPSNANSAVVATLVAIGVGFVAGLLLAPKSGKDTTALLKRKVRDAQGRFQSKAEDVRDKAKDKL
jgi:gas vesicle protein